VAEDRASPAADGRSPDRGTTIAVGGGLCPVTLRRERSEPPKSAMADLGTQRRDPR